MFFLLYQLAAFAGEPDAFVNVLSIDGAKAMAKIAGRDPKDLVTDPERIEWARARFAWISLKRLQGREAEAVQIFAGCGEICGKYGPEREWLALRVWGCQKRKEAKPCLHSQIKEKTKAQKPPH